MTLVLVALWIAGHEFNWWWLPAAVLLDVVWLSIKLNFLAMLVRRSFEVSIASISESSGPPPEA